MIEATCVLCGEPASCENPLLWKNGGFEVFGNPWTELVRYKCPSCGHYILGLSLQSWFGKQTDDAAFKVACLLSERRHKGEEGIFGIYDADSEYQMRQIIENPSTTQVCGPCVNGIISTTQRIDERVSRPWRIDELLKEFPKPTEMIDRALLNLERLVKRPMDPIGTTFDKLQLPLFCPKGTVHHLYKYMLEMKLITQLAFTSNGVEFLISPAGWNRIAELKKVQTDSRQGFVAMWFDPTTDETYEKGIVPAITDAGYKPMKIDNKEHNNKIDDEIVAEIRRSRFVVADITAGCCKKCATCEYAKEPGKECKEMIRPRGGVYFEAGFAMGLGIPVIWTVHKDQDNEMHFDTRQYKHIIYKTPEDLREQLLQRIRSSIA